jgi:geranylgeranyl reductase family protein
VAESNYDVIVAGAGPAGSTTAHGLAKAGLRVLLLDRAKFPRVKPCGGGVTARAFAESPVDLAPVVEREVDTVRFSFRLGEFFDYTYPRTLVYMTQRHRLDAHLAEQASYAGADFDDGCALKSVSNEADGVEVQTDSGAKVRARVLVGADGANGIVGRSVNLHPVSEPPVALEANFPYEAEIPPGWNNVLALELGSMPGGYGWSFPKADHFNVGCGGWQSEGGRLRDHLAALRAHYDLDDAAMLNLRGHHLPTRTPSAPIVRGRVLLVGDAAGLVDPMSGEGIYAAFVSGRLAARSIMSFLDGKVADLLGYEAAVDEQLMGDIRGASVLHDAYHYTPRPCYLALRHSDLFRRMLCELMLGERTYEGFLRSLGPAALVLRFWAARGRARRSKGA